MCVNVPSRRKPQPLQRLPTIPLPRPLAPAIQGHVLPLLGREPIVVRVIPPVLLIATPVSNPIPLPLSRQGPGIRPTTQHIRIDIRVAAQHIPYLRPLAPHRPRRPSTMAADRFRDGAPRGLELRFHPFHSPPFRPFLLRRRRRRRIRLAVPILLRRLRLRGTHHALRRLAPPDPLLIGEPQRGRRVRQRRVLLRRIDQRGLRERPALGLAPHVTPTPAPTFPVPINLDRGPRQRHALGDVERGALDEDLPDGGDQRRDLGLVRRGREEEIRFRKRWRVDLPRAGWC